jgi:hypothetical protein
MKIAAVNSRAFTPEILNDAINASKDNSRPMEVLVIVDDYYKTFSIDYHDGERNPHLVRIADKPDYLDELLKPATK